MRVYLSGQNTFGNRGCEAIVRSTVGLLRQSFGDVETMVPSARPDLDAGQWPDAATHGVRFVDYAFPTKARAWVHAQRLPINALKRSLGPVPSERYLKDDMASADLVLAVGGDNYSLDYRIPSRIAAVDRLAMDMGKPVILWGASVGPFEKEKAFVPTIRDHLARMSSIIVRESASYDYLKNTLGLSNVVQSVDPAFTLKPSSDLPPVAWPEAGEGGLIGLNVSPLIEKYAKKGQSLIDETISFVKDIVQNEGCGVMLVPHVMPLGGPGANDDATYLQQVLDGCAGLGERVTMSPRTLNATELKALISKFRFFIGARTHATIAALSSAVPTISIAYSVKARGINRDLFGSEDVVLPTHEVSASALRAKFDYLVENENTLRQVLSARMPEYRDDAHRSLAAAVRAAVN